MNIKICVECKTEKPISEFGKNKRSWKDGLNTRCKSCMKERYRVYYLNNKEKESKRSGKYRSNNKERISKQKKEYYLRKKTSI